MNWKIQWKRKGKHMSKMMIVAATSEKMLELMDKITIEEGVISFLASNKATAKGYPCMFSVEGKTTTASVKFEAKIKKHSLERKGESLSPVANPHCRPKH